MRKTRLSMLLAATLLLAGGACGEAPLDGAPDGPGNPQSGVDVQLGELHQRVEFSDVTPQRGDTILITSTVTNRGAPRGVQSRICGFDITLLEKAYEVECMGYGMHSMLGTGESLTAAERRVANLSPGTYDVRVRHLLDPERWVVVTIVVSE